LGQEEHSICRPLRQLHHRRRGNTLLVMCLICPAMIALAMGIAEYGSFFQVKADVQHATREGAREAIRSTATNASVQSAVDAVMSTAGLQSSGYTVTLSPAVMLGLPTGQPITVTVSVLWANAGLHALPAGMGQIPGSKQITETLVMNRE
jgi:Flp pilus assembly protein TadG